MPIARRIARPMLAAMFISGGLESLRDPKPRAAKAGGVATKIADALPVRLPDDPVRLVQIDAGVKIVGGFMLATGRLPRLAALALAGSLVPTTLGGHKFWEFDDPQQRKNQQVHFLKNVGLLGGLILAAVDTEGRPSAAYRTRTGAQRTAKQAKRRARQAAKTARQSLPD
ncbi:MAG: DoxX family membrane protein [Mycobacteriales bacterium]